MGIRETLQDKPAVAIVLVVVVVAIVGWRLMGAGAGNTNQWAYDLQTGQLVKYTGTDVPPMTLANGNQGVLAHVWMCGKCSGDPAKSIMYLEKYSDEGKALYLKQQQQAAQQTETMAPGAAGFEMPDRLLAAPPAGSGVEITWHPARTAAGGAISRRVFELQGSCPKGKDAVNCRP